VGSGDELIRLINLRTIAASASEMMVGIAFAALVNCVDGPAHYRGGVSLIALVCGWFEKLATCLSARRPSEGSLAQYLVDHIFVYRCNQNLPDNSHDV
jgi:hypothetical protein